MSAIRAARGVEADGAVISPVEPGRSRLAASAELQSDPPAVLAVHARSVAGSERSAFADQARAALADDPGARGLVLETCHRVEAWLAEPALAQVLSGRLPAGGRLLTGTDAARHAARVAVGLESIALGEDQVLHQLRSAVADARAARRLTPELDRLFDLALRAGRRARSWRQGPALSLADVALAVIDERTAAAGTAGPDDDRPLLVVGAGEMGRLAVRAAGARGRRILVASRTAARAEALARSCGAGAAPLDPGPTLAEAWAVVVALRGPWPLAPASAAALVRSGAVVVDLSMPSAVAPDLARALGARLVTADDLARHALASGAPALAERARLEQLVESTVAGYLAWLAARRGRNIAAALAEQAEAERRAELDALFRRLPRLDPEARAVIEGMSRHLARRILREPIERLGDDPDGRREQAVREAFGL